MEAHLTPIALAFMAWCLWNLGREALLLLTLEKPSREWILVLPTLLFYAASGGAVVYLWVNDLWALENMYGILQPHFLVLFLGTFARAALVKKEKKKAGEEAKFRLPMTVILYAAILLVFAAGVGEPGVLWPGFVLIALYFLGFAGEGKLRNSRRESSLA